MASARSRAERGGEGALDALWAHHHAEHRDPELVVAQWGADAEIDPALLESEERGEFWDALAATGETLLVTREYEHLVLALRAGPPRRRISALRLPHPSGIAVDERRGRVFLASTRNPNMVYEMAPAASFLRREGEAAPAGLARALAPLRSVYLPGALYIHDLALVGGALHANAVGLNAVIRFGEDGAFEPVWWPRSIDAPSGPRFERNFLQLNSIAAGRSLETSFFTASSERPSRRRPGHRDYAVDRRGVVFGGRTREVVARGLTRPHSARLSRGELWVDDSGYGAVGRIAEGRLEPAALLPGWTRGLAIRGGTAFIGTSRVIPRFERYAPGLDPARCECALHAVDLASGSVKGSLVWPRGNQVFGIELLGSIETPGFPRAVPDRAHRSRVRRFHFAAVPRP